MEQPHPYGPLTDPQPQPAPAPARRRVPRFAVAAGVTTFLALGGAGLAFATAGGGGTPAASLSSSSSTSTTVPGHANGRAGWAGHIRSALRMGGRNVVHGEYTVKNGSAFAIITVQSGQVTSVSSTSITVRSPDGYTQIYKVQPTTMVDSQAGGISAVAATDQVRLQGLLQGNSRTATDIVDVTKVGDSRGGFGLAQPPGPGMPGPRSHMPA